MSTIVKCPKCKGRGKVHDIGGGIFTFGLQTFFELINDDYMDECPRCKGSGFLRFD